MDDNRNNVYYLEKVGNGVSFENAVKKIKGVTFAHIDSDNKTLEYAIDEWTSDYDVFTEIVNLASQYGAAFDFEHAEKSREAIGDFELRAEQDITDENIETEEELPDQEVEDIDQEDEAESARKKAHSEKWQRVIELSLSAVAFAVSLFLQDMAQFILLSVAFAVAGYDVLYDAIAKIFKKQFISEELLLSLAFFGGVFLGYATEAVAAVFSYSVGAFLVKLFNDNALENPNSYTLNDSCKTLVQGELVNRACTDVVVGEIVNYTKPTFCLFDCTLKSEEEINVISIDKSERTVKSGEAVFAGEKLLAPCESVVVEPFGEGRYDTLNSYVKRSENSETALYAAVKSKKTIILIVILAFCLLTAFLPPVFYASYSVALERWAMTAVIIAAISSVSLLFASDHLTVYYAALFGKSKTIALRDFGGAAKIAKMFKCCLDKEETCDNADGTLKDHCAGAVRELKDCKFGSFTLVGSADDKTVAEACKTARINEYYAEKDAAGKLEVLNKEYLDGALCVAGASASEIVTASAKGAIIQVGIENVDCENADAVIVDGEPALLPCAVKLAKRTHCIVKTNSIVCLAVKTLLIGLAFAGVASLWWAVVADTLVGILALLNALRNKNETI